MTDFADRLRRVRTRVKEAKALAAEKWDSSHFNGHCEIIYVTLEDALDALPDPDEVERLETQNAQLHDELGTRADALGERTRQRNELAVALRRAPQTHSMDCPYDCTDDYVCTCWVGEAFAALEKLEKP